MYIKYFVKFVELNTKVASFFPFWIAVLYYLNYLYPNNNNISIINFIIFFVAMLCFDMATTAINHYQAFKLEKEDQSQYDSTILEMMSNLNITMKHNKYIIIAMLTIATILGVLLVILSNIGVLLLGMLCFLIGVLYSFGPKPISHTPIGEFFAGGTMGIILPVIVLFTQYNHLPFELNPFLAIVFVPLAFLIGNILLANNICDLDKDVNNNRYTIVYYLGQKKSVLALHFSNLLAVIFILISLYFNFLVNFHYILIVFLLIPLTINTNRFAKKLSKQESFIFIVKNFILFASSYIILLLYSLA